jgi:hypothetical protein
MNRTHKRIVKLCAAVATTVTLTLLATPTASADSWYGRPNTMTCVYTTTMIDGPTNVPLTGDVTWEATVHVWDKALNNWRPDWSTRLTNRADSAGITAGPWYDADQIPTYVVSAAIPVNSSEPVTVAVYNRFYSWETGQWVDGFWSLSNLNGGTSCVLTGGGIVV